MAKNEKNEAKPEIKEVKQTVKEDTKEVVLQLMKFVQHEDTSKFLGHGFVNGLNEGEYKVSGELIGTIEVLSNEANFKGVFDFSRAVSTPNIFTVQVVKL